MSIDISELETSLLSVYQKNLNFFKENFFHIYQKIETLSDKISKDKTYENYSLELCSNYFDIKNLENNGFYYSTNSYLDAEEREKTVDFSLNRSFDLLRKDGITNKLVKPLELKDVLPIVDFINKEVDLENIEFQEIKKFIYIGVGLGLHINEIDKKIKSYTTLIIEPELEIFRLSMFTLDYTVFAEGNRKLILSVGNETNQRKEALINFYYHHDYMNYNVKYYNLLNNLDYIHDEIAEFFGSNFMLAFPYHKVITNLNRTLNFVKNEERFLKLEDIQSKDIINNKKVLMISAGPSLDNYIDLIEKEQEKFIIVCVDVIVRKLEKHNIVPDIVFSIDPSPLCAAYLTTVDPSFLKDSAILLMTQQHQKTIEVLKERNLNLYCSQFSDIFEELGYLGTSENVGTFSFLVMVRLEAKELYLIGNDAAFDQRTGSRYSKDSSYSQVENLEEINKDKNFISLDDVLTVKGNLQDEVKTNRSLLNFKHTYDVTINYLKDSYNYTAYNLSDGVFVDGLNPLSEGVFKEKVLEFEISDFQAVESFNSISCILNKQKHDNDIKIINSIIQRSKKFQKLKFNSKNNLLEKKLDLMIWILESSKKMEMKFIGKIFLQYTEVIDTYINFMLNLKQRDLHDKKHIDLIGLYWSNGVISVFKDIKDTLK